MPGTPAASSRPPSTSGTRARPGSRARRSALDPRRRRRGSARGARDPRSRRARRACSGRARARPSRHCIRRPCRSAPYTDAGQAWMSSTITTETAERHAEVSTLEVSVVIPCLNEAESIEACVARRAGGARRRAATEGEVVVVDNGSTDGSGDLAAAAGARVVEEPRARLRQRLSRRARRRPRALHRHARRRPHLRRRRAAAVRRRRSRTAATWCSATGWSSIQPGAMPWLHRHVGNPVLTGLLNRLLRDQGEGRPLRDARPPPRGPPRARPPHHRDGARIRDGDPGGEVGPRHPPVPDRVPPAAGRVEALDLERRLAASALPAGPQPHPPLPRPRGA